MKKELAKTTVIINILAVVFLFCTNSYSQDSPVKLSLDIQLNGEIKNGVMDVYAVDLLANQTARIEVVQDGIDVALSAVNPQGEEYIISLSPSGYFGDELILVTATDTGVYKVGVSSVDPRRQTGKYKIILKEIRPTVAEDFQINEASAKVLQLAGEADQLKYNGTIEGLHGAIAKWDEVIVVSKIKKDKVWEGVAVVAQGLIYEQLGELQKTLDSYLQSLKIWREIGNRQYEGSALNNLGSVYTDLGEVEKSLLYYKQAIEMHRQTGDRNSEGYALNNLAFSYMRLGDYDKAEDFFRQSLVIKLEGESLRDKRTLSNTLNNLGTVLILKGETSEGLDFLQQALNLRKGIEYPWGVANSLLNLGKAQWNTNEKETAFENLTKANKLSLQLGDRRMQSESFYLLAKAEKENGHLEKAIENIRKGLEIIEEIRSKIVGSESRYAYFSTVQNFYELYTELLVSRFEKNGNKRDVELAFEMSERSRSRSLVELLQEAKVDFKKGIDPNLLAEQKNLQKQINDKYARRETLLGGKPKPEQITQINSEISELNTQIQSLKLKIRRENPKFADLLEGKTTSVNDLQKLLGDETVLLEYKLGEKRSFVWFVTKNSIEIFGLPSRTIIEEKAKPFYDSIVANKKKDEEKTLQLSRDLSEILLKSFASKINNKRLAIVADGILQYAPFSALLSPKSKVQSPKTKERFLIETNEIVMLPSATVLARLRENPNSLEQNNKTIAIFADPVFDIQDSRITKNSNNRLDDKNTALTKVLRDFRLGETLPRLLASRQEARNISNLVDKSEANIRTDFEANLENIEAANLKDYKILHFATHGLLNSTRPELSGLVFSLYDKNGNKQNGFLSLNDIYNLDLSSDLIVLSACQTALGKEVRGEGLIGMSRGFLYAGSNRIIASLWKVDDSATAEFMKRFYTNHLQKGMSASKALQHTKNEMKKIPRYKSSYYWSAFTLLGDWK